MMKILFVCSGNTCRSPMAQALTSNTLGPNVDTESAGMETASGMSAARHAVEALKEIGIDMADHRTRRIEEADLADYDRIVAMTPRIGAELRDRLQVEESRLIVWDVPDPFGKGIEEYRRTICALKRHIQILGRSLDTGSAQMDIREYVAGAIQRISTGELSSDSGSHLAGVYGVAAKEFESTLRERLKQEIDKLEIDYNLSIRPHVPGRPGFDRLTLGRIIHCIREVSEQDPSAFSDLRETNGRIQRFLTSASDINDRWVDVKHGGDTTEDEALHCLEKMEQILDGMHV